MSSATGLRPPAGERAALNSALQAPRIRIEQVAPSVDQGVLPAKGVVGQPVTVEADIFMDGYAPLAARLIWRGPGTLEEQSTPLQPLGNDRWRGAFVPHRSGRHRFNVEAWLDDAGAFRHVTHLPSDLIVDVERLAAGFTSAYELFPRSQSPHVGRHGTFDDVIARLPALRAMGFDALHLPPIHPIGWTNRRGRNGSPQCEPDDPGSPYAVGSAEGGHTALHPQLGDMASFHRLLSAAAEYGLELVLDLAMQCSRDHPWLTTHPEWFSWHDDGTIRSADDSVEFDFYAEQAQPGLWLALRDVVLYWIDAGVRAFRVAHPHTQPLPFWRWLIADVRSRHPDVLFVAHSFGRPALLYRLAKLGFSQSYTYFIWRNSKGELTDYFTELGLPPVRDFLRPLLFVNTPEVDPRFLQSSGRPGFLIRAALAATLSGLWGLYSGFELCESAALPGSEEYLNAEKYQLRQRDWQAPGNIIAEITQLNAIRRQNPALQSHRGLRFYEAFNEQVIWYGRFTPELDNFILVAVSLDPYRSQEATFEVPLWEFGLTDNGVFEVEELMRGIRFKWYGKLQHWRFVPSELPFAIFRVRPWQMPAP